MPVGHSQNAGIYDVSAALAELTAGTETDGSTAVYCCGPEPLLEADVLEGEPDQIASALTAGGSGATMARRSSNDEVFVQRTRGNRATATPARDDNEGAPT